MILGTDAATRVEVNPDALSCFKDPGEEEGGQASRNIIPVALVAGGEAVFESALMRLVQHDGDSHRASTEHRNLPFTIHLAFGSVSTLEVCFDADKSSLVQGLLYQRVVEAVERSGDLRLVDGDGRLIARAAGEPGFSYS